MKPAAPKAMVSASPGRAEKLPAPGLARLLRGKEGSRSRARSSPMFVSRSKSVGRSSSSMEPTLTEEGEPSSPKVTCIGQVRIRKKKSRSDTIPQAPKQSCRCFQRALVCNLFPRKPKIDRSLWRKWGKGRKQPDPAERPPEAFIKEVESESESESVQEEDEEDEEDEEETRVFVSSATKTPPKNALLLMRCRSAPHNRSSALATARFPVSPLRASESPEEIEGGDGRKEEGRESFNGSSRKEEEEVVSSSSYSRPLGLTRCKSEPAKMAAKVRVVGSGASYCSSGSGDGRLGIPPLLLH